MAQSLERLNAAIIKQRCGDIDDWKIAAIEASGASIADLEAALAWAAGESDVMGEERRPLEANAARLYDILTADQPDWDED